MTKNAEITRSIILKMYTSGKQHSRDDILGFTRDICPDPTPQQIYNIDCIIKALVDTGIFCQTHSSDYRDIKYSLNLELFKMIGMPVYRRNPVLEYQSFVPEACALMDLLTLNNGGPVTLIAAEELCSRIPNMTGDPLSLCDVIKRYPDIITEYAEVDTDGDEYTFIEFTCPFPPDDTGEALYRLMAAALKTKGVDEK